MEKTLPIPEAAKILQVTQKTIRNYIKRGFLKPEMWNGKWLVPKDQILELCEKKNINMTNSVDLNNSFEIGIPKDEYAEQLISVGKLHAYENLLMDVRSELAQAQERIVQLEASSAAGWSEARTAKAEVESLQQEITKLRGDIEAAEKETGWLRREKDRMQEAFSGEEKRSEKMKARIKELEDRLHARALYNA